MNSFSIIISDTIRSLFYLINLYENNIYPKKIYYFPNGKNIFLDKRSVNKIIFKEYSSTFKLSNLNLKQILNEFIKKDVPIYNFKNKSVNSTYFYNKIKIINDELIIFSGYSGEILSKRLVLTDNKFVHIHAGYLPKYKGSTTNYYSSLESNFIGFTAIFMNEKIDNGKIIFRKKFNFPKYPKYYDLYYDNLFRSLILLKIIKEINLKVKYLEKIKIKNLKTKPYYVIHPILKMIAYRNMKNKI